MKKKKEKLDVRNYATELKMLSTSFLEDLADSETVEFEQNGKKASGKISREGLLILLTKQASIDLWSFDSRSKYKQVFETLGLTCWRDDLYCSDISKITYRNTVLYEREVAYE